MRENYSNLGMWIYTSTFYKYYYKQVVEVKAIKWLHTGEKHLCYFTKQYSYPVYVYMNMC